MAGVDEAAGATEANPTSRRRDAQAMIRLNAVSGPGQGRGLVMTQSVATVGRHPTNDLVLPDPRVSGVHLELARIEGGLRVRDSGSTNGTWAGATRLFEANLSLGAEIVVGDTLLRVESHQESGPPAPAKREAFGTLVGAAASMRELFATLERIAAKELSVLVQGETGTGKEEVARSLHAASARATGPFIVIDATSLPENLAESLLFGHEKGAFTGATDRRRGFFDAASHGTIFIDELGELPPLLQAKFLRVLERREITPVGGTSPHKVDVRVIAATNRDLRNEIDKGRFREDLYFRIAQVRVHIPPLRDRPEDIPLLCARLLGDVDSPTMIEASALEHLCAQPWPGNVRELKNVLIRAAAMAHDGLIRRHDVSGEGFGFRGTQDERTALDLSGTFSEAKERAVDRFERAYLRLVMRRCDGNLSQAAREADLARHHMRDLLKKRGLYGVTLGDEDPT
jgi:DNA-binding NtrC family response regulator